MNLDLVIKDGKIVTPQKTYEGDDIAVENGRIVAIDKSGSFTEAKEVVDCSEMLALGPCDCRAVFHNCDNPIDSEIMVGLSRNIFMEERPNEYREITKQEARDILKQYHQKGLIHTLLKCRQDFYAICNCCPCCCVPLRLRNAYGIDNALTKNKDIVQRFKEYQSFQGNQA